MLPGSLTTTIAVAVYLCWPRHDVGAGRENGCEDDRDDQLAVVAN